MFSPQHNPVFASVFAAVFLCACGPQGSSGETGSGEEIVGSSAFVFSHHDEPLPGAGYDTGWQPANSPVQVRFLVAASALLDAKLPGKAALSREEQLELSFAGDPGAGSFKMDIGFEISATLRINQPPLVWEGGLPLLPQFDLRFNDETTFTPFILEGSNEHPHLEDDARKPKSLYEIPLPGLSIAMVAGGFVAVKVGGRLAADLYGQKIVTKPVEGNELVHVREGERVAWPVEAQAREEGESRYQAQAKFSGEIIFYPTIEIAVPMLKWSLTIAEFPIPIDIRSLVNTEQNWTFDPVQLKLAPEIPSVS